VGPLSHQDTGREPGSEMLYIFTDSQNVQIKFSPDNTKPSEQVNADEGTGNSLKFTRNYNRESTAIFSSLRNQGT